MPERLIFTASTGRCGTGYLARMLSLGRDIVAVHEPQPDFVSAMRNSQREPHLATEFWVAKKLPAIDALEATTYVETSHLFCKGFDAALEALQRPFDLIDLARPHREVASSLFRMNTIPSRTTQGLAYCLHPDDPDTLPLPDWRSLHDYQLCYWYCLEMERRRRRCAARVEARGGTVVKTTLDEIAQGDGLTTLMETLAIDAPGGWEAFRWSLAQKCVVNTQRSRRSLYELEDIDLLERQVDELCGGRESGSDAA